MQNKKERILSIDIIRGAAIFGIFLVNMMAFHSPLLYLNPFEWWTGPFDRTVYFLIDVFAQASFYPLFALLFGYGLVLLRQRVMHKGVNFQIIALRRMALLLVIGILHAFLIWHGDILITYAVLGCLFLFFIRMPGKAMLAAGTLFYVIPNLLIGLLVTVSVLFAPENELTLYNQQAAEMSEIVYREGSFFEITEQRIQDWYMVNNPESFVFLLVSILPLFFIGGGAAKLKWIEKPEHHRKKLLTILAVSSFLGLLLKLLPYLLEHNPALDYFQDIFGGPLLAVAYGLGIVLATQNKKIEKLLAPLAAVGKLSLSNYLLQSLISTLIFYQYGLGLYGKVSVFTGTLLVVGIYAVQMILSRIWLKHFYYGPIEWIWRSFTYFSVQGIKRE